MDAVTVTYLMYIKDFPYPLGAPHPRRMALITRLLCASFLVLRSHGRLEAFEKHNSSDLLSTCNQIAKAVSGASQVFLPRECDIPSFVILHSNG
jgi:hypothetical protein